MYKPIKVTITLEGNLPSKYLTPKHKKRIEERIKDDVMDTLGEYEIWGEFFGKDSDIYALFLENVKIEEEV